MLIRVYPFCPYYLYFFSSAWSLLGRQPLICREAGQLWIVVLHEKLTRVLVAALELYWVVGRSKLNLMTVMTPVTLLKWSRYKPLNILCFNWKHRIILAYSCSSRPLLHLPHSGLLQQQPSADYFGSGHLPSYLWPSLTIGGPGLGTSFTLYPATTATVYVHQPLP